MPPEKLSTALMDYFQDPSNISPKEADALRIIQSRLMQDSEKMVLAIRQQFRKGA